MRMLLKRWAFALLVWWGASVGSLTASADVAAYNAALKSGDVDAATDAALAVWADFDLQDENALLMAREFAFTALRARRAPAAAEFLETALADPRATDQERSLFEFMDARRAHLAGEKAAEKKMIAAIEARASSGAPAHLVIMSVSEAVARELLRERKWNDAHKVSKNVSRMWRSAGPDYLERWMNSAIVANAAAFVRRPHRRYLSALRETYDEFYDVWQKTSPRADADKLNRKYLEVATWEMAMMSSLRQTTERSVKHPTEAMRARVESDEGNETDPRPFCAGQLVMKNKPKFPAAARAKMAVGAVTVEMAFDKDGQVINPKVIAAAPNNDFFIDAIMKTTGTWKWVPDEEAEAGCRLNRDNVIQSVQFLIR